LDFNSVSYKEDEKANAVSVGFEVSQRIENETCSEFSAVVFGFELY
jgi:hypothetical protein